MFGVKALCGAALQQISQFSIHGVVRHPAVSQRNVEVALTGNFEHLRDLAVEGRMARVICVRVTDAHKRPVGRVGHGAVAFVRYIPGHAGGQHIPLAAMLKHSRRFAAERRVQTLVLPADFFFRLQEVPRQAHRQLTVVVCVHIEICRIAANGNVKVTDLAAKRAVVGFDNFIGT